MSPRRSCILQHHHRHAHASHVPQSAFPPSLHLEPCAVESTPRPVPSHFATQRNTSERNATQRNATQRNATQRNKSPNTSHRITSQRKAPKQSNAPPHLDRRLVLSPCVGLFGGFSCKLVLLKLVQVSWVEQHKKPRRQRHHQQRRGEGGGRRLSTRRGENARVGRRSLGGGVQQALKVQGPRELQGLVEVRQPPCRPGTTTTTTASPWNVRRCLLR